MTDPNGKCYIVYGELKKFCIDNNLSYLTLLRYKNKGKIPIIKGKGSNMMKGNRKNSVNWEIVDFIINKKA